MGCSGTHLIEARKASVADKQMHSFCMLWFCSEKCEFLLTYMKGKQNDRNGREAMLTMFVEVVLDTSSFIIATYFACSFSVSLRCCKLTVEALSSYIICKCNVV